MKYATIELVSNAGELTETDRALLSAYLGGFHEPQPHGNGGVECPRCKRLVSGGGMIDMLLGTLRWGLVHGEGFCSNCSWPFRVYHTIKLAVGEKSISMPMAHRCYSADDHDHEHEMDPADWHPSLDHEDE